MSDEANTVKTEEVISLENDAKEVKPKPEGLEAPNPLTDLPVCP
ncbi:2050_t:CDS:2, partial [Gigaspora rosea]